MREDEDTHLLDGGEVEGGKDSGRRPSLFPIEKYPILPREENRQLAARARAGDPRALDLVVRHNMRLIYKVARRFRWSRIPFEDLVQEGVIGFMRAVALFEVERGLALTTYALWWVRQAISRFVCDNGQLIQLPTYLQERIRQILETQEELLLAGVVSTDDAVAKALGITEAQVGRALDALRRGTTMVSLDDAVPSRRTGENREYSEVVADRRIARPEVVWEAKAEIMRFMKQSRALDRLIYTRMGEQGRQVLRCRYGFNPQRIRHTLESTGQHVGGVTRERVRQIETGIWKVAGTARNPDIPAKDEFLRVLDGLPDLEELAQVMVDWEQVFAGTDHLYKALQTGSVQAPSEVIAEARIELARAHIEMLKAQVKAVVSDRYYQMFCGYYGLGQSREGREELALRFEMTVVKVRNAIQAVWGELPRKHFDRQRLLGWLKQVEVPLPE